MAKNGKKLTAAQRSILMKNGIVDPENWLYVKMDSADNSGYKSMSKNNDKTMAIIVQNKITKIQKRIEY